MTWRRASAWIALFAALAAVGGGCADQLAGRHREDPSELAPGERPNATLTGEVVKITDGDTIKVRLDSGRTERVRYIGMDTPETKKPGTPVQCFGRAATAANTRLVERRRVRLQLDTETRDRYGRLLRYVDVGRVDAGLSQIRKGYAIARYDSRDGYGRHPREDAYIRADAAHPPKGCAKPQPLVHQSGSGCAPGYSPCVPPYPPDLDCADLDGPIRVTGSDPHGLDADGDGVACEP